MRLAVFGLAISSSWGNGHATLWRGLIRALARRGVDVIFFERDRPWYAASRDAEQLDAGELVIYGSWPEIEATAERELCMADAAIVTTFCPDAVAATRLLADAARPLRVFYDLDTPVTLEALRSGQPVAWLGPDLLAPFDLVLSFTGGAALGELCDRLGARRAAPLYGHVDPTVHRPAAAWAGLRADLSYIGTFAEDRQAMLERLLVEPARLSPGRRFLVAGSQYPDAFPWQPNIHFIDHLPPPQHPVFFASSRLTLNVTRQAMASNGWCPSGRLFEAAACGAAIVSDAWPGLDAFLLPGSEILLARDSRDVLDALDRDDAELARLGARARERVLAEHTSDHRAGELLALLDATREGKLPRDVTPARATEPVEA